MRIILCTAAMYLFTSLDAPLGVAEMQMLAFVVGNGGVGVDGCLDLGVAEMQMLAL